MAEGTFGNPQIVEEEVDILIIGGGMAACGAAFEVMRWTEGTDIKIKLVDKAAIDRSGAGDTVSAVLAAALAAGASIVEAAVLASHAAGIAVGKAGVATVSPDEIMDSIERTHHTAG